MSYIEKNYHKGLIKEKNIAIIGEKTIQKNIKLKPTLITQLNMEE